jgi:hypothetical protein
MSKERSAERRFVRLVLAGAVLERQGRGVSARRNRVAVTLDDDAVAQLVHAEVLSGRGTALVAGPAARAWLTRTALAEGGALPAARQAREEIVPAGEGWLNLAESPLVRLARPSGAEPAFLAPHQAEAGERLRRLAERARMNPRITLSYDPTRLPGRGGAGAAGEVADSALDARRRLGDLLADLPDEMAGVALDVCGLLKGLQQVEQERAMPRRSAKLVLRLALELLARRMGLGAAAQGPERGRQRGWLGERPADWG